MKLRFPKSGWRVPAFVLLCSSCSIDDTNVPPLEDSVLHPNAGDAYVGDNDAATDDAGPFDAFVDSNADAKPNASSCPMQGKGCCAFLLNLSEDDHYPSRVPLHALAEKLEKKQGCDVHLYDMLDNPNIRPKPRRVSSLDQNGRTLWNMTLEEEATQVAAWRAIVDPEAQRYVKARNGHQGHAKEGREVLITIVDAHGSECGPGSCGKWTSRVPGFPIELSREDAEIYKRLAFRNVCEQVFYDGSCHAGCTAALGRNLNERNDYTCKDLTTPANCCARAGYRANNWLTAGPAHQLTNDWAIAADFGFFSATLDRARAAGEPYFIDKHLHRWEYDVVYNDEGRNECCPDPANGN